LNPGKGHDILLRALAACRDHPWHLTCVGNQTRSPQTTDRVRSLIHELRLTDRVTLAGELTGNALTSRYVMADAFVLATLRETYGMAVAEAIGHGLPVISTRTGAIATLVGDDAGLLAPPGELEPFAGALTRFLNDAALRASMRQAARIRREQLQSWDVTVDAVERVMARLTTDHHRPASNDR
jgi:glycosyltransferase involved in cell wall biosynthesis